MIHVLALAYIYLTGPFIYGAYMLTKRLDNGPKPRGTHERMPSDPQA